MNTKTRDLHDGQEHIHGTPAMRRQALLDKMAADRVRLATASRLGAPPRRLPAPGDRVASAAQQVGPFLVDHALAVAAGVLGLAVLGPRRAVVSAARAAAPTLLIRGVRALLARQNH